jgi:GPH family glycoside/pentoside/hexuronide:cation symporter
MCAGWLGTLSAMQYYFTYIIGDVAKMTLATSLMTGAQLIAQLFTSVINKYITKRNILQIATVFQIVAYIGLFFIPGNLALAYVLITINGLGLGSRMVIFFSMIPDTTDYGEYLCGRSLSGTQNAFTGFMNKLASAAMSAVISALLVWGNYDQALAVQPDSAITAIKYGFCGIPLITCLVSVVVMAFYNLDKIYPDVKKEIEKRRKELENAAI